MEFLLLRGKRPSGRKVPLAARSDGCFCWLIWHCLEQAISERMHTHLWGRLFALLGNSLDKIFGKIVSTRVKNLRSTSLVTSRHIQSKGKRPRFQLTYLAQKRLSLSSLLWYVYVNFKQPFLKYCTNLKCFWSIKWLSASKHRKNWSSLSGSSSPNIRKIRRAIWLIISGRPNILRT